MRVLLTRVVTGVATAAVSVGLLVGTTGAASAAGCQTSFGTYSTVTVGTTGSKALAVECLLHDAGYRTSRNGAFSTGDANKLKQFQTKHTMRATGRTNGATWAALVAQGSRPALQRGDSGASVRRLQLSLRALGHSELPGTTRYGTLTEAAVKNLQAKVGLKSTGRTSASLWAALQNGAHKSASAAGGGSGSASRRTNKGGTALAFAKKQVGEPYQYGAAGPDRWDCSGLTQKAWAAAGVKLPHNSKAQFSIGRKVAKSDLRPGDLVFFYSGPSHVGIYAGNGQVVHAPRPGKRVEYIKMTYMPWAGARRPG